MIRPPITVSIRVDVASEVCGFLGAVRLVHCAYCYAPIVLDWREDDAPRFTELSGQTAHFDHFVPLSRGGAHTWENLLPTCARCNTSKGARFIDEWLSPQDAAVWNHGGDIWQVYRDTTASFSLTRSGATAFCVATSHPTSDGAG